MNRKWDAIVSDAAQDARISLEPPYFRLAFFLTQFEVFVTSAPQHVSYGRETSMRLESISGKALFIALSAWGTWCCSSPSESGPGNALGGSKNSPSGSGGAALENNGGTGATDNGDATDPDTTDEDATDSDATDEKEGSGGATTIASSSGAKVGTGGRTSVASGGTRTGGVGGAGVGGVPADTGEAPVEGDCVIGAWPAADPSVSGPYATVTESSVGPEAGVGADGEPPPKFTMFRPKDMAAGGLCHPVITWGNGTGANPGMYKSLLSHFASHGFVVIASDSPNVGQGDPKPMLVGVTWVLEQNEDPSSVLYHRVDATHVGATGHSQGAVATSQAAGDSRITTCVPIEGAMVQRNLHGPAMLFCGGQDTIVGCSGAQSALNAITTLPAMYAEYLSADHGSWMSFRGDKLSDVDTANVAWMRVHLMGDTELRPWFYGESCKLCTDAAWKIDRKNMDQ